MERAEIILMAELEFKNFALFLKNKEYFLQLSENYGTWSFIELLILKVGQAYDIK